jgi:hypothetical protein
VRTAALTTSSPAALREYLKGEDHLRALRGREAADAFRAAVELDSTFALACDATPTTPSAGTLPPPVHERPLHRRLGRRAGVN